jgi:hypothetical protein
MSKCFGCRFPNDFGIRRQQIITAHTRLARQARRDDDNIGAFGCSIIIRADDFHILADNRHRLQQVQGFPLWHSLYYVNQNKISNFTFSKPVCSGCARHACANDRDFVHDSSRDFTAGLINH